MKNTLSVRLSLSLGLFDLFWEEPYCSFLFGGGHDIARHELVLKGSKVALLRVRTIGCVMRS